jgi:serine/threonine-protein kinase
MNKKAPFLWEIGLGLVLTGAVCFGYARKNTPLETANFKTYDLFSRWHRAATKTDDLAIVEIDENAVSQLGRWPWPRNLVAQLLESMVSGGARVIGLNILFTEPEQNEGVEQLADLEKRFSDTLETQRPIFKKRHMDIKPFETFLSDEMESAKKDLDGDSVLAESISQAANVVLPMYFQPGDVLGNNLDKLPDYFEREQVPISPEELRRVMPGNAAELPIERFARGAVALGHSNLTADQDGTLRRIAPLMRYGAAAYPSFGVELVREFLKLDRSEYSASANRLSLGKARIPLDEQAQTFLSYVGPAGSFKHFSAVDVLSGALPDGALKDKIVLIGVTAPGLAPTFVSPSGESFTGLEIWATHISNVLNQQFIARPSWAKKAEWTSSVLAALIVLLLLPLVRAQIAVPTAAAAAVGLLGGSFLMFNKQDIWVSPSYATILLLLGFIVIVGRRLVFTEHGKELVEAEGMETNKMLGLSFQGQGMLDLAFEKFRRCSIDGSMKDLLYNLGLDMERKRQFSKAAAVYEHIATADPKFKDIREKIELLKKAGEGAVFGTIGKKTNDAAVVVDGLGQNTTLGRYEIVKELGRGAMGIVYLGKDPKINRQVAVKTLRFEEELDEDQTKSIKDRFFREAESAGNLTHPNIIRIFDAGEDQDVAYIAMELLDGEDLKKYTEKATLLPEERAVEIIMQVAFGLDYAHKQGVVHRDIKPANIMLLKDGTLRITDFGIARIQATSKTATGAVLGTPAYMSPEQVNGKKVDGRADVFSLGVTMYEMLTGEKPFVADSIAALLYRIANVDHPDPREFNSAVSVRLLPIINKALAKDPDDRYQTAGELGDDLRIFLQGGIPKATPPPPPEPAIKPVEPQIEPGIEEINVVPPVIDEKQKFLTELQEAFKIPGGEPFSLVDDIFTRPEDESKNSAPEPEPDGGDTVIIPPSENPDRTVVLDPDKGPADLDRNVD